MRVLMRRAEDLLRERIRVSELVKTTSYMGGLDESECVMAKWTERKTARKAKAPKRTSKKVAKKATKPKRQTAKRALKTKAKPQKTRAKSGRSGAKPSARKPVSRRRRAQNQQQTLQSEMMIVEPPQTETTVVDVIEEPAPGVFVVTEFVETNAEPEPAESLNIDQTVGPESEEQQG